MFCLMHTEKHLIAPTTDDAPDDIPYVDFIDIDKDGMVDMVFYHNGLLYAYKNLHEPSYNP